jgi:uncharacterized protein (DUF58 family)
MIRPTRRAVLLFGASVLIGLVIAAVAPGWWIVSADWAVFVLAGLSLDALLAAKPRALSIDIDIPERLFIGETGGAKAMVALESNNRPARVELLLEQIGDAEPPGIVAIALVPGGTSRVMLPIAPRRRGRVVLVQAWLRWNGPFGLVQITHRVALGRSIDVVQNIRGVHDAALQFFAREAIYGTRVQRERGGGSEFDALAEYVPGLDTRVIDWKHSARHGKLVVKEFRVERNHPIIIAFDTGYLMAEPIDGVPRLDHAVNAGLLLAWIALKGGDLVGLYGFDSRVRHYVQPVRGLANFSRLARSTAGLDYHRDETNFTLGLAELAFRQSRRALIVLFTDFVDTVTAELLIESLQRIVHKHVVLFVSLRDPALQRIVDARPERFETVAEAVIADDFLKDRRLVFDRLARLGIQCLDVPREALSAALINHYLRIEQRGML